MFENVVKQFAHQPRSPDYHQDLHLRRTSPLRFDKPATGNALAGQFKIFIFAVKLFWQRQRLKEMQEMLIRLLILLKVVEEHAKTDRPLLI